MQKNLRLIKIAIISLVILCVPVSAFADTLYDDQQSENDYYTMGSASNLWGTQFTASDSYTATSLEIYVDSNGLTPIGDGTWSIRTVASPNSPLCTGTLDTSTIPSSVAWESMALTGTCDITASTDYVITFDEHTTLSYFHWHNQSAGVAGNGSWLSTNNGTTWAYYDAVPAFTFRLYGTAEEEEEATSTTATTTSIDLASTTAQITSTNFGLAIIIVLLSLSVIGTYYGYFVNRKRKWQ